MHHEKFDQLRKSEFLTLIAKGIQIGHACVKVGISRRTYEKHCQKYEKFRDEVTRAQMDANELVEQSLFKSALGGNVTAQQVWLYNRSSERWQDRRNVMVGGDKDNPIEVNLSGDELNAEIKRLVDIAAKAIEPAVSGKGEE